MAEKKLNHKFHNYVQSDGVIKEVVSFDKKLKSKDKWNFYNINKICLEVALEEGFTEEQYKQIVRGCACNKQSSCGNIWKLTSRSECPKTSAGEVGWRHEPKNHNLELYGPLYKSPKLTMMPVYEPAEVIFLG